LRPRQIPDKYRRRLDGFTLQLIENRRCQQWPPICMGQRSAMIASVQMTAPAGIVAGPRGLPSTSNNSVDKSYSSDTSSLDESSQSAHSPEDDDASASHSSFGAILHQFVRQPSSSSRPAHGERAPADQQKRDAPDPNVAAPVQTNEKPRDIAPLTLANPWSKGDPGDGASTAFEGQGQSSASIVETPDPSEPSSASGKSAAASNPLQATQADELAFAARLSVPGAPAAADESAALAGTSSMASSISGQGNQKQTLWSDAVLSSTQTQDGKGASDAAGELLTKITATAAPAQLMNQSASQNDPATSMKNEARPAFEPSSARLEKVAEPPAAQPSSGRDIMVRIPDSTEGGTNVHFAERGSEVHVSVRTGDSEMAQMLRGSLNDLSVRLQHSGIQAEMWRPGADSQSDSQNQAPDPKDSGERRNQSGAQRDGQDQPNQNRPRWVEELETSMGRPATQPRGQES
jgi:hypothetical protein